MKNKYKALCGHCNFSNNVMKITTVKNCAGENVTFITKFEHKFIKWCNANHVRVINGENVAGMYICPDVVNGPRKCILQNKPTWTHKAQGHMRSEYDVYPDTYVAFCRSLLKATCA